MKRKPTLAPWVRLVREPNLTPLSGDLIRSPEDVFRLLAPRLQAEEVEVFVILALDTRSRVRSVSEVSRGLLNSSLVHPREVFRIALAMGAMGIILAHNHPSGDATPSADDQAVTRQLVAAGELLDIPVFDHVVIAGSTFTSFATRGLL